MLCTKAWDGWKEGSRSVKKAQAWILTRVDSSLWPSAHSATTFMQPTHGLVSNSLSRNKPRRTFNMGLAESAFHGVTGIAPSDDLQLRKNSDAVILIGWGAVHSVNPDHPILLERNRSEDASWHEKRSRKEKREAKMCSCFHLQASRWFFYQYLCNRSTLKQQQRKR